MLTHYILYIIKNQAQFYVVSYAVLKILVKGTRWGEQINQT